MSLGHSPKIVTNGLVFYYDMQNSEKSWKGKPTINVVPVDLSSYTKDNGCTVVATGEYYQGQPVYRATFPSGTLPRFRWDFSYTSGQVFTGSVYYKFISGNESNPGLWFRESGFGTTYQNSTFDYTTEWAKKEITHTFSSSGTCMFLFYRSNSSTTIPIIIDFALPQCEQNSFATPFVNGTRSNTQAIVDLTGHATITASSPTFNSDGSFSFNGGTESMYISNSIGPISNHFTISAWVNSTSISSTQNILSMNGPYFMRIFNSSVRFNVLTDGGWLFQNGTTVLSSNTWYYFTMVWDGTNNTWTGYINDKQEFSVAKSGTMTSGSFYGYVGYTPQGGEQSNFFGQIPVVQYYNRALSADEVTQNFNALRGRYGV